MESKLDGCPLTPCPICALPTPRLALGPGTATAPGVDASREFYLGYMLGTASSTSMPVRWPSESGRQLGTPRMATCTGVCTWGQLQSGCLARTCQAPVVAALQREVTRQSLTCIVAPQACARAIKLAIKPAGMDDTMSRSPFERVKALVALS